MQVRSQSKIEWSETQNDQDWPLIFVYACFPFIKSNFFASLWEPVHHSEKWPTTYLYNYADPLKQWMLTQGKFAFESLERMSADLLNKSLAH